MVMKGIMIMRVIMKMNSSSYRRVLPLVATKIINDFAVCKHCSGTHLLVKDTSHGLGSQNYVFQKGTTLFNRST